MLERLLKTLVAALVLMWSGCGAPGDPMPPLLNIPARTTDLEAVQRGEELILRWSVPSLTTEGLALKDLDRVVIQWVEVDGEALEEAVYEAGARKLAVLEKPTAGRKVERRLPLPAAPGRRIALAVENYGRRDRVAGHSNVVMLEIAAPPAAPGAPRVTAQADAILLEWPAVPGASGYQVYRSTGDQPGFALLAAVEDPRFADADFAWDAPYRCFVRAYRKTSTGIVEGADSAVEAIVPRDTFPPSPPQGLRAVAGDSVVDLSWNLSPEPDTAGYHIYRRRVSDPAGPTARLNAELLAAPAFSDKEVEPGQRYSYTVSAVDDKGNESAPSTPVDASIP